MTAQQAQAAPASRGTQLTQLAGKYAYRGLILFVLAANILLGAYVVAVILPSVIQIEIGKGSGVPVVAPSPTPTPAPETVMAAIGVVMPPEADCFGCHSGPGVTKPRPVMAHPLDGWRNCTECHAPAKLVETAAGHSSLHKEDCLACHTARVDQSPAPKPHHSYNGTTCTACHGNNAIQQAPLPTDMAGRTNCWVCHGLTEGDELWNSTPAPTMKTTGQTSGSGALTRYPLEPTR